MRAIILLAFISAYQFTFAQLDTVLLKEVTLKYIKITPSEVYKKIEIDSSELAENYSNNLGDLLDSKTSLYVKNSGAGMLSTLSIRGASAQHTQLYWNGININSPTLGMSDLSLAPIAFVNDIELHYGASGIVDGSGSIGGSIQLFQNPNWNNKIHAALKNNSASFNNNTKSLLFEIGNKKIQSQTNLIYQKSDNEYTFLDVSKTNKPITKLRDADYRNVGFTQNIFYKINLKNRLSFRSYMYNNERNLPAFIGATSSNESQTDKQIRTMLEWQNFASKYKQSFKVAFVKDNQNYLNEGANINSRILAEKLSGLHQFEKQLLYKIKLKTQLLQDYSKVKSDGIATNKEQFITSGLASLERVFTNRLFANIVVRQELLDFEFVPFTPSIGLRYQLSQNKKYFINANTSRTYRAPTLNDKYWIGLGNPDLIPEQGYSSEIALSLESKKSAYINTTFFHNQIENWIQWLPDASSRFRPTNLNKVASHGVEVDASKIIQFNKVKITFNGSYTYTNIQNKEASSLNDNSLNKQLIYVPFHKIGAVAKIEYSGYKLTYTHTYTGRVYIQKDHSYYLPIFYPASIRLLKSFKLTNENKLILGLMVNNLFDEDYQVVANRPMPKRNYGISLVYDFNKK